MDHRNRLLSGDDYLAPWKSTCDHKDSAFRSPKFVTIDSEDKRSPFLGMTAELQPEDLEISNTASRLLSYDFSKDQLDSRLEQLDQKKNHIMSMLRDSVEDKPACSLKSRGGERKRAPSEEESVFLLIEKTFDTRQPVPYEHFQQSVLAQFHFIFGDLKEKVLLTFLEKVSQDLMNSRECLDLSSLQHQTRECSFVSYLHRIKIESLYHDIDQQYTLQDSIFQEIASIKGLLSQENQSHLQQNTLHKQSLLALYSQHSQHLQDTFKAGNAQLTKKQGAVERALRVKFEIYQKKMREEKEKASVDSEQLQKCKLKIVSLERSVKYQQQKTVKLEMENRVLREEKERPVEIPRRKKKVEKKTEPEEKKSPERPVPVQPSSAKKEAVSSLKVIKKRSVLDIEQRNTLLRIIQLQALQASPQEQSPFLSLELVKAIAEIIPSQFKPASLMENIKTLSELFYRNLLAICLPPGGGKAPAPTGLLDQSQQFHVDQVMRDCPQMVLSGTYWRRLKKTVFCHKPSEGIFEGFVQTELVKLIQKLLESYDCLVKEFLEQEGGEKRDHVFKVKGSLEIKCLLNCAMMLVSGESGLQSTSQIREDCLVESPSMQQYVKMYFVAQRGVDVVLRICDLQQDNLLLMETVVSLLLSLTFEGQHLQSFMLQVSSDSNITILLRVFQSLLTQEERVTETSILLQKISAHRQIQLPPSAVLSVQSAMGRYPGNSFLQRNLASLLKNTGQ